MLPEHHEDVLDVVGDVLNRKYPIQQSLKSSRQPYLAQVPHHLRHPDALLAQTLHHPLIVLEDHLLPVHINQRDINLYVGRCTLACYFRSLSLSWSQLSILLKKGKTMSAYLYSEKSFRICSCAMLIVELYLPYWGVYLNFERNDESFVTKLLLTFDPFIYTLLYYFLSEGAWDEGNVNKLKSRQIIKLY